MHLSTMLAAGRVDPVPLVAAVALAAGSTVLALRLLGIRRGWGKTLLAGTVGWGIAGFVALRVANWSGSAGWLVLQTFALALPITMAVAVGLDLIARPGSLATGERAGLVIAPKPLARIRRQIGIIRRYRELVTIARRHGFGPRRSATSRLDQSVEAEAVRLRRVLEEAGGVYVKIGQIAATRVDLLPAATCDALALLQNNATPVTRELIEPVLVAELGGSVDEIFRAFDWEPLAAASIGQTYLAELRTGEQVVVKVQRPGVDSIIDRDLAALSLLANVVQRRTQFGQGLRTGEMMAQFAEGLRAELDFRKEADAMTEMAALMAGRSEVRVPRVFREHSSSRVLVQERFDGVTVADLSQRADASIDRTAIATQLLRSMLDQIMTFGLFHADPHPGNIFVLSDGSLGLIDFGAVGRLDAIQQTATVEILAALVRRDVGQLREGLERLVDFDEAASPDQMDRALARLVADHLRVAGSIDPSILQDLIAMLARFGIRLPTDMVLLSRALATVDGTLRVIDPCFHLVDGATHLMRTAPDPVIDPEQMVKDEFARVLPQLRRMPERIDRILALTAKGELRIRSVVDEDSRRVLRTLVNRGLLAFVGTAFALASVAMLVARDRGPSVGEQLGLYEVIGYGGLLAGTVLLLRVAGAIARDGTT